MASKDIVVGWVGKVGAPDQIATDFKNNGNKLDVLNNAGQTIAVVSGIFNITQEIGLNIPANAFAGTITALKIVTDITEGHDISAGDVISLAGNIVGIAANITVLAASAEVAAPLIAIGAGLSLAGVLTGDNISAIGGWFGNLAQEYWPTTPISNTLTELFLATDNAFHTADYIAANGLQYAGMVVTPSTGDTAIQAIGDQPIAPASDVSEGEDGEGGDGDADGGGAGDPDEGDGDTGDDGDSADGDGDAAAITQG
ncbi:hypothetical protein KR767_17430 [Luteibacter anthropi]|uniref:Uncharacterized protein n=1 Tax=Luteibacter anthropi TaxID=564369 RepID=A0A7X5U806_9GAMM|nr:hypothetical protein [Luteibacter anthropi]NII05580.1 hypothetical protein [Luteibacter anthropi]URX61818.1 hypothetical protein KR767_17430 [Luteibacter anthropi]